MHFVAQEPLITYIQSTKIHHESASLPLYIRSGVGGDTQLIPISTTMSLSRPARCLFSRTLKSPRRSFHTTPCSSARQRDKGTKPDNNGPQELAKQEPSAAEIFKRYTDEEKAELAKKYTPAQLAAIEAGEEAVDPEDLLAQARFRQDPFTLPYLDDLSKIVPVIDKPIRAPEENFDPNLRLKTDDEIGSDLAEFVQNLPEDADRVEWMKFMEENRLTVGKAEAELNPRSSLAPDIPRMKVASSGSEAADKDEGEGEHDPLIRRLMKQTGFTWNDIRKFRVKNLVTHRVVNQTRMGKIQSQYFLTVAGNGNGLLGIGEGKSAEPEDGMKQARMAAIRNMQPINRYENRTIYGEVTGKVGAVELKLSARPPGTSLTLEITSSSQRRPS